MAKNKHTDKDTLTKEKNTKPLDSNAKADAKKNVPLEEETGGRGKVRQLHPSERDFSYEAKYKAPQIDKHSKVVSFFKLVLPSFAVVALALMLLWPELIAQKERFAVGISRPLLVGKTDTLSIVNSRYFSTDSKNQPFKLSSVLAIEEEPGSRIINLEEPMADILLNDGMLLMLEAKKGIIYQKENKVVLTGSVRAFSDKGHEIKTQEVAILLDTNSLKGTEKTYASFPNGNIEAEGLLTKNKADIIKFTGNSKLIFTPPEKDMVEVTASRGIELHQKEEKIIARKNATVKSKDGELKADKITAFYKEAASDNSSLDKAEVWKIEADGNVVMMVSDDKTSGNKARYTVNDSVAVIWGKPAMLLTATDKVTAKRIEYRQLENKAIAKGDVKIIRDGRELMADEVLVDIVTAKNGKPEVTLMTAMGNVSIVTEEGTASGDRGEYAPKDGTVLLIGNVKLTKDGNHLQGYKFVVNLNTGKSEMFASSVEGKNALSVVKGNANEGQVETKNNTRIKGVFLPDTIKKSTTEDNAKE